MSFTGMTSLVTVLILITLLMRQIGKNQLSWNTILKMWDLVLLRSLIPFRMSSDYISFPVLNDLTRRVADVNLHILITLWVVGTILVFLWHCIGFMLQRRRIIDYHPFKNQIADSLMKEAGLHRKVNCYINTNFRSPLTIGLIKPKIMLPADFEKFEKLDMRNMILHELQHIIRNDVAKRYVVLLVVCIYWFNPAVWIMRKCYFNDQELACDERVIRKMTETESVYYARTLLSMIGRKRKGLKSLLRFHDRNSTGKRVTAALEHKKTGILGMLLFFLLFICSVLSFC